MVKLNDREVCQEYKTLIRDAAHFVLFVYLPFNHFESCLTVRRVGLSPRLRYMTASIARKSVTVAEYSFPSGEERKKKQEWRCIRNNVIRFFHQSNEMGKQYRHNLLRNMKGKVQLGKGD